MQGCVQCDCESSKHHEEVSHCQVEQDEVQRSPQLFVLDGDIEGEEVDGEGSDDKEQHVHSQKRVLPRLGQVVLRVLKWAENQPSLVRHGNIEVGSFCTIHDWCCRCFFFLPLRPWPCTSSQSKMLWRSLVVQLMCKWAEREGWTDLVDVRCALQPPEEMRHLLTGRSD